MPNYRRNRVLGGTYFFTVNLLDRRADLLVTQIDALRASIRAARAARPFHIDAWVVLPDHMHCVWTLPEGDDDFPGRWRTIKTRFTKMVAQPSERGVWQPRYWEHIIRDDRDYSAHVDYTHFNPVKHGYAQHPSGWRHSTFQRCVERGLYPVSWRGRDDGVEEAGERGGG